MPILKGNTGNDLLCECCGCSECLPHKDEEVGCGVFATRRIADATEPDQWVLVMCEACAASAIGTGAHVAAADQGPEPLLN